MRGKINIKIKRLKEKNILERIFYNRMIYYTVNNILVIYMVYRIWGYLCMNVYLVSVGLSITFFEAINYVEHYGLRREGKDEKVNENHSWDAPYRFSNYILFKH